MWQWLYAQTFTLFGIAATAFVFLWFKLIADSQRKLVHWIGWGSLAIGIGLLIATLNSDPTDKPLVDVVPQPKPAIPEPPPAVPCDILLSKWSANEEQWPIIEFMAKLSQLVYQSPVEVKNELHRLGFEFEVCIDTSMVAYILKGKNVNVLVFRGTDDSFDWVNNLRHSTFTLSEGGMHQGFWSGYVPLGRQINICLDQEKDKPLWITGHSLGGAMAALCAFDRVVRQNKEIVGVVTFGQPRFADAKLGELLNRRLDGRYMRVVNAKDGVPRMPGNLKYCGSLLYFSSQGVKREIPGVKMMAAGPNGKPSDEDSIEPPAMSEQEFRQFQAEVRKQQ
jgi:triacylglycerol lipase